MRVLPWEGVETTNWSTWNREYLDFKTWSVIYKSWYQHILDLKTARSRIGGDAVEEGRIVNTHPELLLLPSPPLSWKFSFTLGKVWVKPVCLASSQVSKLTSTNRVAWGWGKDSVLLLPPPSFWGPSSLILVTESSTFHCISLRRRWSNFITKIQEKIPGFPSDFFLAFLSRPLPLFCPECDLQANCHLAK